MTTEVKLNGTSKSVGCWLCMLVLFVLKVQLDAKQSTSCDESKQLIAYILPELHLGLIV